MERRTLGKTGIDTTILGIGTLTMSPIQRGLGIDEGARVLLHALEQGISLIDTAQTYGSYPQVGSALLQWNGERPVVITKSGAASSTDMFAAIDEARKLLGLDMIDGFLLHAVRNQEDFDRRQPALEALMKAKERGTIRAIGASSHSVRTIALLARDPRIELLHPIVNQEGFGVLDASLEELLNVLREAKQSGKGIYAMKPLGGGHLRHKVPEALQWFKARPEVDSIVVGMTSMDEVDMNVSILRGSPISPELEKRVTNQPRRLFINEVLCKGCGTCVEACEHKAIQLAQGKASSDPDHCVLCGYCAPECPHFAIRII